MSTVLCIFSTEDGDARAALRERLAKLQDGGSYPACARIKVLQPIKNDPFLSGRDQVFSNLVAIVKFIIPAGNPMSSYMEHVSKTVADLNKGVGAACHICVTSPRQFKTTGDESVNYFYFMKRKEGFSRADYLDYYANSHFNFGMQTNGITYIQNYIDTAASEQIAENLGANSTNFDSVSEMRFSSINDFFSNNSVDSIGEQATQDELRFVDRDNSEMVCCESFYE